MFPSNPRRQFLFFDHRLFVSADWNQPIKASIDRKVPLICRNSHASIWRNRASTRAHWIWMTCLRSGLFTALSLLQAANSSRLIPSSRSFIRGRYTTQAEGQMQKDYVRTRDDLYRMQLDDLEGYHQSNRDNMVRVYHSYLQNTPGSKKALRELCDQLAPKTMQDSSLKASV